VGEEELRDVLGYPLFDRLNDMLERAAEAVVEGKPQTAETLSEVLGISRPNGRGSALEKAHMHLADTAGLCHYLHAIDQGFSEARAFAAAADAMGLDSSRQAERRIKRSFPDYRQLARDSAYRKNVVLMYELGQQRRSKPWNLRAVPDDVTSHQTDRKSASG